MFCIISISYAIVRYRFLEIEIIVKKVSLVSLAFIASVSLIYIGTFYFYPYLYGILEKNWIVIPIFVSFLVGFGLFRFVDFVRHIEENELSKKFAYRPLLKKESERISMVRNINELLAYVTRDLSHWVRLDYVGVFVWKPQSKEYILDRSLTRSKSRKKIPLGLSVSQDNPLVAELMKRRKPLIYSEMEYYLNSRSIILEEERDLLFEVIKEMERLGTEISIPSLCEGKLLAIINIGHKLNSKEIVTNEDLDLFLSFSNQIARAIYGFMLKQEKIQLVVASQNILIAAIEAKDFYTRGHTERVAHYCTLIGGKLEKRMRTFFNGLSNLKWAAQLHDVGKISIPDSILLKPSPLNAYERLKIREHPMNGIKIISPVREWLGEDVCEGILHHHENYDGSGYPSQQKMEDIHLFARIIRVIDAFDAMTTDRPYRFALPKEKAIAELKRYKNIYFDIVIVNVMEELYNNGQI